MAITNDKFGILLLLISAFTFHLIMVTLPLLNYLNTKNFFLKNPHLTNDDKILHKKK